MTTEPDKRLEELAAALRRQPAARREAFAKWLTDEQKGTSAQSENKNMEKTKTAVPERFKTADWVANNDRIKLAKLEQRTAKCEDRLQHVERTQRQRTRDAESSLAEVIARLENCERMLGIRSDVSATDSAGALDGMKGAKEARAHAESMAALNKRNHDFWAAEQER